MTGQKITIGIDVSKKNLDVCAYPTGETECFSNTSEGVSALLQWTQSLSPERIVLEPSGGYERLPLTALQKADAPVSLVNARQIRDYARAKGILAKTDALDAQVSAEYGAAADRGASLPPAAILRVAPPAVNRAADTRAPTFKRRPDRRRPAGYLGAYRTAPSAYQDVRNTYPRPYRSRHGANPQTRRAR